MRKSADAKDAGKPVDRDAIEIPEENAIAESIAGGLITTAPGSRDRKKGGDSIMASFCGEVRLFQTGNGIGISHIVTIRIPIMLPAGSLSTWCSLLSTSITAFFRPISIGAACWFCR